MSDSDDEDFAFFGNPLEAFDEDAVPRKKPISVEEQIATDKYGKRRFHGAFTGGFSAGFYNSVGSLEGFKPSTFKSSRNERTQHQLQLPTHFMDQEDTDEFGIAPQVLQTKDEYSSTKRNSRKRDRILDSGPIPGRPVLESILKPAKHTMGILLLMKMGWKPGQGIGERLEKKSNKEKSSVEVKTKVYGCARGPHESSYLSAIASDSDSDLEDEIYRELGAKAPSFKRKEDNMGLGYKGLDRNALNFPNKSSKTLTLKDQFNKTIKISGQAFGVGAFEEDDDDIYSTEDKSQYDFSLEPLSKPKKSNNLPAISSSSQFIIGFVKGRLKETLKQYPGPLVPSTFTGQHVVRKSGFDLPPQGGRVEPRKQRLDAELRSVILGTQQLPPRIKEEKLDDEPSAKSLSNPVSNETREKPDEITNKSTGNGASGWKPFSSDSAKQERYERYLNLIKIGAKDLVCRILLNTMSDLERESELREFDCAARLYSGQIMSDRFTHAANLEDDKNIKQEVTEDKRMRQRITTDWSPHPLVCKRFNIKPPDNVTGTSLKSVAESKKRPKFSVFDFLNTSKSTDLLNMVESNAANTVDTSSTEREIKCEIITGSAVGNTDTQSNGNQSSLNTAQSRNDSTSDILFADDEEFEEPEDKMDLFKAIFLDSDEESGDEENQKGNKNVETNSDNRIGETVNVLRNTSPPRGIFANLDLDKMANRKHLNVEPLKSTSPPKSIFDKDKDPDKSRISEETEVVEIPQDSYGPILPSDPLDKPKTHVNLKLDVNDQRWVEKTTTKEKHRKSKHRHHHKKKHKKEKKRDKHKKKKKKKYSSSDSSSETD